MAERLARRMIEHEASGEIEVESAGIFAVDGEPPSPEAVEMMNEFHIELGDFRSRQLTPRMVDEADEVYVMTESHRRALLELAPDAQTRRAWDGKTQLLDPAGDDIADPFGHPRGKYRQCARDIQDCLLSRMKELTT